MRPPNLTSFLQKFLIPAAIAIVLAASARAELRLSAIFSDHAVLQRTENVPVWGRADAGQPVSVTLGPARAAAVAGADGKWRACLDLQNPAIGPGPHRLVVQAGGDGGGRREVDDVLIGEVWLCSGQSNMEFRLAGAIGAEREIAQTNDAMFRQFLVKKIQAPAPADDCVGEWTLAEPKSSGEFSAVAWFFGKNLRRELGAPVGLVNASWGGTCCEFWMSAEAFESNPELRAGRDARLAERANLPGKQKAFREEFEAWAKRFGREDNGGVAKPPPDAKWVTVRVPGKDAAAGAGVVWFRRKVQVVLRRDIGVKRAYSATFTGIRGYETVYWNGRRIGGIKPGSPARNSRAYAPPGAEVAAGEEAEVMVRIYNPLDAVSLNDKGSFSAGAIRLDGDWEMWIERAFPEADGEARASYPKAPPVARETVPPSAIYNGMIHPNRSFALRGVIWYQGESNTPRAVQYRTVFSGLIRDWRGQWGLGDLPFYFCQLASFHAKPAAAGAPGTWAELRESQARALELPHTGMAVLVDIGEAGDIHPRNKSDAGDRLSRIALANAYGRPGVFSGPVFDSARVEKGAVRVRFRATDGGLVARELPETYQPRSLDAAVVPLKRNAPFGKLEGFTICGEDGRWCWAGADIEGDEVVVSSPEVPRPVAVRYGWADNPTCNLYNGAGLPAAPFRTDDFPLSTAGKRY
jgi:sialate O-acetylesterase